MFRTGWFAYWIQNVGSGCGAVSASAASDCGKHGQSTDPVSHTPPALSQCSGGEPNGLC